MGISRNRDVRASATADRVMQTLPTWIRAPVRSQRPDGRNHRLTIIVPYRDRAANLRELLPAMHAYFLRDGDPRLLPLPQISVVEQCDDSLFNKGALCNVGFLLHRETLDYVCIHDVDCVPLNADYSYTDRPARLIEQGTRNKENLEVAFGAVVALSKADFERCNGFSNAYVGWGLEDTDLLLRIVRLGMTLEARPGVFRALPHAPAERDSDGNIRREVHANLDRWRRRFDSSEAFWKDDGLSTLRFTLIESTTLSPASADTLEVVHHRVGLQPAPAFVGAQRIDGEVDKRADFDIRCDASPHTDAIQVSNEPSEGLPAIDKNTAGDAAASRDGGIALTQIVGDGNQAAHRTSVTQHTPDDFLLRRRAYPGGMGARRPYPRVAAVALTRRWGEDPSRQIRIYVRNVAVQ